MEEEIGKIFPREFTSASTKKYVLIYGDKSKGVGIVENPVDLFRNGTFDPQTDKLYDLGSEVNMEIKLVPKSVKRDLVPSNPNWWR
jgi:hypothetical protein